MYIYVTVAAVTGCTLVWDNYHRVEHLEKFQLERISITVNLMCG